MNSLILYDGQCALCDGVVRFLLHADRNGHFQFAPLQGETAAAVLNRWFPEDDVPDAVMLVEHFGTSHEQVFTGSDVMIQVGEILDGMYRALLLMKLIPRPVRDELYRVVARTRRALFGTVSACPFIPGCSDRFLP